MPDVRITQHVLEFASPSVVPVRETQHVIEIASPVVIDARITQDIIEVLAKIQVPVRITQDIIEVIMPGTPDVSGIYFINPKKAEWHDSYYGDRTDPLNPGPGIERKIPDPTIRLPLLGD